MFEMFEKVFTEVMIALGYQGWWELADSSAYERVYIPHLAQVMGISVEALKTMSEFQQYEREMAEEL